MTGNSRSIKCITQPMKTNISRFIIKTFHWIKGFSKHLFSGNSGIKIMSQ